MAARQRHVPAAPVYPVAQAGAELAEHAADPAMAERLRGPAFQIAMKMKRDRLDLTAGVRREMEGDELLAQPSHLEWHGAA
eukprot:2779412-Pyramimonas_sp.AAC.1